MTTVGTKDDELEKAAAAYEEMLVPVLFAQWTDVVLDRARIEDARLALDVACGTGVLARRAAQRMGQQGRVTGLDLNPAMLSVAKRLAPQIEWRQGDVRSLPFAEDQFDAVVSQFGLMLFEDRTAALTEMLRVLAPGGRLAVAVFDSLERIPAYSTMAGVFQRQAGKQFGDALRYPFSLGDSDDVLSLFDAAGMTSVEFTSHTGTASFRSVEQMVLSDVRGWFPVAGLRLDEATLEAVVREAHALLAPFTDSVGQVRFDIGAHVVTAVKD